MRRAAVAVAYWKLGFAEAVATAKYDKNTVHSKLEEMREIGEADTIKVDRKSMIEQVRALSQQQQAPTARYDRTTVHEQLQRLRQDEEAEAHEFAKDTRDESKSP